MVLKKLKELISINKYINNDIYEYVFFNKTKQTRKLSYFLSPDIELYSSPLNPLFSFELESSKKSMIKSFEIISLRDGVLFLMDFFYKNPNPDRIDPILVIDEKLSPLVPAKWREKVVLRKIISLNMTLSEKKKKIIIFISPDKRSSPIEIIKNEISKIKTLIDSDFEIKLFFSSVNKRGEEEAYLDDLWGYKLVQLITAEFLGNNVEVLNWKEYLAADVSGCYFHLLNPLMYYFSDSYVEHNAFSRGALPLFAKDEKLSEESCILKLTVNHGFVLHREFSTELPIDKNLPEIIFKRITMEKVDSDDYKNLKLVSDEFMDWAADVSSELYKHKAI